MALYRGDLLDGIAVRDPAFEDWLLVERERLRQLFERALVALMAQALAADDRERAAAAARRLLLLDPLSEAAYRALMQVHADEGQTAQALKLYDGLRERLHRELGVRPEPATVALCEHIRQRRPLTPAHDSPPEERAPTTPAKPSIAVLPFLNLSGDLEQQYFSDGITEDIITELSRFRGIFVIARNSSFRYRGDALDMKQIGRELGVRYLAEGSVRRIGGRIRISAQLIDAESGHHLWAANYDREAAEILAVQDDIVKSIATTLGYRVEAAGRERALRLSPEALSAHDLVLRSDALLLRFTRDDNAEARRLAEKAVELDPRSAVAHVQLGWTHCMDHLFGWVEARAPALDKAVALARRAVLLDEADSRARTLLGFALIYRREYEEARAHLRAALALNPNDEEARAIYGVYLTAVGESEAALEQFQIAARRNPFEFTWVTVCRGIALFTARRYEEAIATLLQAANPDNEVRCWLAASYAAAGRLAEARAVMAEFLEAAEREMPAFPGRALEAWKPHLRAFMEYRDPRDFEHLFAALRAAGLE
jgi:TolB-like protein